MKYDLTKGHEPGRYAVGEGHILDAKDNELTERQAAPFLAAGILKAQSTAPKATPKGTKKGSK